MKYKFLSILRTKLARCSNWTGKEKLKVTDAELWKLLNDEKKRQISSLSLIASENFAGRGILECLGSALGNKYAEGYPGSRYYRGNDIVDKVELLAQQRLLNLFNLNHSAPNTGGPDWGVNVQPYSGSPANIAVYTALLKPHDRLMGLHVLDGGHVTHGFATCTKNISAASIYFESMPYRLNPTTDLIDYDMLQSDALKFKPKLIIAGVSAYPRLLDYERFRKICDSVGAILLADMAHVSGLIAAGVIPSPFPFADIVTSTAHKTLRGPRSGMIFYHRNSSSVASHYPPLGMGQLESRIGDAVYPSLQGGPHQNAIAGVAAMAREASTDQFREYSHQVVKNAQSLSNALQSHGIHVVSGGTDVHFLLVDLIRSPDKSGFARGSGAKVQLVADLVGITLNKINVPGDEDVYRPSGLRLGSPALTSRGFKEKDFQYVANLLNEIIDLSLSVKNDTMNLEEFRTVLLRSARLKARLNTLRENVTAFASQFPMPGWEEI